MSPSTSAAFLVGGLAGATAYAAWQRRRDARAPAHASDRHTPAGLARCRRVRHVVDPDLALDLWIADAPARTKRDARPIVVYVLDPEPVLFAAVAAFVFSQSQYLAGAEGDDLEARYGRISVVGVGHAAEYFSLDREGFDAFALRDLRRRDFPAFERRPSASGRRRNARAARFADALVGLAPYAEVSLLHLAESPVRCVLGASDAAVVARVESQPIQDTVQRECSGTFFFGNVSSVVENSGSEDGRSKNETSSI